MTHPFIKWLMVGLQERVLHGVGEILAAGMFRLGLSGVGALLRDDSAGSHAGEHLHESFGVVADSASHRRRRGRLDR